MKDWYSIGEFSKKTQLSVKALRHYQEIELLIPHARGENQYRYYSDHQVVLATRIHEYKSLGFSLDEIKMLLHAHHSSSLQSLLEKRLGSIKASEENLAQQKRSILSILTSLKKGLELSDTQRSFIMEDLITTGIEGLKRRGVSPSPETLQKLENEVKNFSSKQEQVVAGLKQIVQFAKDNDILLGPGRGASGASLVLFSQGYSPISPLKFNLIPELFAGATMLWMDVEFSRSKEIGELCRQMEKAIDFEVVAFKSPFLDILHRVQKQVGVIDFDRFSDDGPEVINAFRQKDLRGIWNFEWNPNFVAHLRSSQESQKKYARDQKHFEEWMQNYSLSDANDILNTGFIYEMRGFDELDLYKSLKEKKVLYPFLSSKSQEILKPNHGLLLYREDWLRILCDYLPLDIFQAIKVFKAVAKDQIDSEEYQIFMTLKDPEVRDLLLKESKVVFIKSHMAANYWYIKRSALLKSLWPEIYIETINTWEKENKIIWQEFGYSDKGERIFEA